MANKTIPVPKYGQTVVDSMGRSGVAKFDPNTGKALTAPQTSTVPKATTTMAPQSFAQARETSKQGTPVQMQRGYFDSGKYKLGTSPKVSTVTISNLNKKNQVPKMAQDLQEYDKRGMVSDGETVRYPDGVVFEQEQTVTNSDIENDYKNSPEYQLLQQMRQSLDAQTAGQIAGIQQQIDERRREVNEYSAQQSKAYERSMLMGGATGKGSQAQFAPGSVQGVMSAQEKYRMKQIGDLDRQEVQLIQAAKDAQRDGDFRLLGQQIEMIKGLRKQKQEEVAKANVEIAKRNQKLRDQIYQASRDNAVADLYQQGITSPAEIFQALQDAGGDFSLKEIKDTLASIVPENVQNLIDKSTENGAPPELVAQAMQSNDFNKAYSILGRYAAKAPTGIAAEYEYYKRDALENGVVPLSFDSYQTQDANRKKSIARAGAATYGDAGLTSSQMSAFNSIVDKFNKSPLVAAKDRTVVLKKAIEDIKRDPKNAAAQLNLSYAYVQALDTYQSAVREGELGNLNSIDSKIGKFTNSVQQMQNGQIVRPETAKEIANSAQSIIDAINQGAKDKEKQFAAQANTVGLGDAWNQYQGSVNTTTQEKSTEIVNNEKQAQQSVIDYGRTNTKAQDAIRKMVAEGVPYIEIQQALGI